MALGRTVRVLAELRQHHEKIRSLLKDLEVLCRDRHADIVKVSAVRLDLRVTFDPDVSKAQR